MEMVEWENQSLSYSDAVDKYLYIQSQQDAMKDWEESDFQDFYCDDVPFLLAFIHLFKS
jgi:hypothetical protein